MTPGARVAAAIAVLDQINDGAVAEQALTAWARNSRFAGSKDRAAVRDHVFDVLRAKRSLGDGTGRSLMQRLALRDAWDIDALFSGEGHAPAPLDDAEKALISEPFALSDLAGCDVPDWLWPQWRSSLGDMAEQVAMTQQNRADVFLRVNQRRGTAAQAAQILLEDGIITEPHATIKGCLRVTENPRQVKTSTAYTGGLVELQDAASQFAIRQVPLSEGGRLLDYCAGGGGKALGFADRGAQVFAHDIAPRRMRDLPARAARAGVAVKLLETAALDRTGPFDVVFCDAPCSGSGTWRRTPDAKWRLTPDQLTQLTQSQGDVLQGAAPLVKAGGYLTYATCSVLNSENSDIVVWFMSRNEGWSLQEQHQLLPDENGDGFFLAIMRRK